MHSGGRETLSVVKHRWAEGDVPAPHRARTGHYTDDEVHLIFVQSFFGVSFGRIGFHREMTRCSECRDGYRLADLNSQRPERAVQIDFVSVCRGW